MNTVTASVSGENLEKYRCNLRDKYVEITTHLLLGDAGKLSFNFLSALDFLILLRKTQVAKF
jgi:hypothetical protein